MRANNRLTRGMRNRNPMNIRRSASKWVGKVEQAAAADPQFEQFTSITFGIRAGLYLLTKYVRDYKLDTLPLVIHRWCPNGDGNNNEVMYLNHLKCKCHLIDNVQVNTRYFFMMAAGICTVESLFKLTWDIFMGAYALLPQSMQDFWKKRSTESQEREEVDGL